MAYVRRRLLKDGKTAVYLAMWREHAQGKKLSKSFERKADAERHLVDMQHRLLTGTYRPAAARPHAVLRSCTALSPAGQLAASHAPHGRGAAALSDRPLRRPADRVDPKG